MTLAEFTRSPHYNNCNNAICLHTSPESKDWLWPNLHETTGLDKSKHKYQWPWSYVYGHTQTFNIMCWPIKDCLYACYSLELNDDFWSNCMYCIVGIVKSDFSNHASIFVATILWRLQKLTLFYILSPKQLGCYWPGLSQLASHWNTIGTEVEHVLIWLEGHNVPGKHFSYSSEVVFVRGYVCN